MGTKIAGSKETRWGLLKLGKIIIMQTTAKTGDSHKIQSNHMVNIKTQKAAEMLVASTCIHSAGEFELHI